MIVIYLLKKASHHFITIWSICVCSQIAMFMDLFRCARRKAEADLHFFLINEESSFGKNAPKLEGNILAYLPTYLHKFLV